MNKSTVMSALNDLRALRKEAFVPASAMMGAGGGMPPGGAPPMDPSMMGGGMPPGGAPPMDPSMMGGGMPPAGGGMPVPPEAAMGMMPGGGAPPGAPPMDPSMMGGGMPPAAGGGGGQPLQVNLEDLVQLFQAVMQEMKGGGGGGEEGAPNEPEEGTSALSERVNELGSKVDQLIEMLTGGGGGGGAPPAGEAGALPPGLEEAMLSGVAPMPPGGPMPPAPPMAGVPEMGSPMTPVAGGAAPPMAGLMPQASAEGIQKSAADSVVSKIGQLAVRLRQKG